MPPVPAGFYFARFSKTVQCFVCRAPWQDPVELRPCGHVFCLECLHDDIEQCPQCDAALAEVIQPTKALIQLVSEVRVMCEHCDWSGDREDVAKHMCRGRQCYLCVRAINVSPGSASAWFGLAAALAPRATVVVGGEEITKVTAYARALEREAGNAAAWCNLGSALGPAETAAVRGSAVTKVECYKHALQVDARCAGAWFNLGNSMEKGDIEQVRGIPIYKDTCYLRAVELDERFAAAWFNLGLTMERGLVVDYGRKELSQKDCFARALAVNPRMAAAWTSLGVATGSKARLCDGTTVTKKECFLRAIQLEHDNAQAWLNLGQCMKVDEWAEVLGARYSRDECIAKGEPAKPRPGSSAGSSKSSGSKASSRTARKKSSWSCVAS